MEDKSREFRVGSNNQVDSILYESPSHNTTILSGLNVLRSKGLLLDIKLIAQGETFQAHKVVLAACSEYFRAMFTTEAMLESRQSEICMNGVSANGIRQLLDYAYTSRLELNVANVQDVLSAATHIQLESVIEACSSYLKEQLDTENCLDVAVISETYSLSQLRSSAYRQMSSDLSHFARSPDFLRLHPGQLEHLLSCDFPVDCSESEVLEVTLRYSQCCLKDHPHRTTWLTRLLRKIHFYEITYWEIEKILQNHDDSIILRLVHNEVFRQYCPTLYKTTTLTPLINSRGMELAIVKVGGFSMVGVTNEITYLRPSLGKWRHLTSIPHVEQSNFGTAVLDNELYVVGGCFNQSLQENIHPFGFRYSPRFETWDTMAPMQKERCRFSLNVFNGYLYAVGGVSEGDGTNVSYTDECERYDPVRDYWERISPLPSPRTQHAAVTLGDFLYVSGGLDRELILSSMYRYDPKNDTWKSLESMITPRADHIMLSINGKIYVCGGWGEDNVGNKILKGRIDCYDPLEDKWDVVTAVPSPRYHTGIVALNSKIYFIGGFHSDAMFDCVTAMIECYDLTSEKWTTLEKYPYDIWEHTCVTLYVPTCRDDMEILSNIT